MPRRCRQNAGLHSGDPPGRGIARRDTALRISVSTAAGAGGPHWDRLRRGAAARQPEAPPSGRERSVRRQRKPRPCLSEVLCGGHGVQEVLHLRLSSQKDGAGRC